MEGRYQTRSNASEASCVQPQSLTIVKRVHSLEAATFTVEVAERFGGESLRSLSRAYLRPSPN